MNKLTEDIPVLEREYRQRSEDCKKRTEEKMREMEGGYKKMMEELKQSFRKKLEDLEAKVMEEKANVSIENTDVR